VGSEIRFTVLERVGPTVNEYVKSHVFKKDAFARESSRKLLVIVLNVVKLSQRLHSEVIVHGDINFGNIAFERKVDGSAEIEHEELVLLNFEFAGLMNQESTRKEYGLPRNI